MDALLEILALIIVVALVSAFARRWGALSPVLLVVVGVALSWVPGVPSYELDPEIVLVLFLPPLLYAAAIETSLPAFKRNLRPIGLLAVGLVLFTTLIVGFVAHAVVPELPLAAAFALGAIVAPPDAVAATAVARSAGLPRRVVTVLEGESLVNDATALTALRVAIVAVGGGFSVLEAGVEFLVAAVGGIIVGAVVALIVEQIRRRTDDVLTDTTISLLVPYAAFVPAEELHYENLHCSGVLAVVVAGLYLGHRAPVLQSASSRLQQAALWNTVEFLLQGVVFLLVGLQLRQILDDLDSPAGDVAAVTVAVTVCVLVARPVWVFPATYLARLVPRVRERDPAPPWQVPTVISWAGMRGVVSLAAAFSLPLDFPGRELILFVTFVVIAVTLLVQGSTLARLIRVLGLQPPDPMKDALAEAAVQQAAIGAARERLEALLADAGTDPEVADRLRGLAQDRTNAAWERLGGGPGGSGGGGTGPTETPSVAFRRLRREMLTAEREVFLRARDDGHIDEEVMRRVQRDLDLEESIISRE